MLRRLRNLAILEFFNVILIPVVLLGTLRMPPAAANLAGLLAVLVVLVEGGAYWWLKLGQLSSGSAAPAGMGVYRVLARTNLVMLAGAAVVIGASLAGGGPGTRVWPGVALWVFAVLEHVNYFHVQLSHDNRADLVRLARTRRLHRSHLARDLERASAR